MTILERNMMKNLSVYLKNKKKLKNQKYEIFFSKKNNQIILLGFIEKEKLIKGKKKLRKAREAGK